MQIFVQCQELHAITLEGAETVSDLKAIVQAREGVSADELTLATRAGRTLENGQILNDIVVEGSYIDATVGLLGGLYASRIVLGINSNVNANRVILRRLIAKE